MHKGITTEPAIQALVVLWLTYSLINLNIDVCTSLRRPLFLRLWPHPIAAKVSQVSLGLKSQVSPTKVSSPGSQVSLRSQLFTINATEQVLKSSL